LHFGRHVGPWRNVSDDLPWNRTTVDLGKEEPVPGPVERVLQTPCGWCGNPITQPPRGRRLRYCDRSCRQRAYEVRTAQARLQRDLDAERVRQEPAERVIERVVQPRHPSTAGAWTTALDALGEQLRTGPLAAQPWHHRQLREALHRVLAVLGDSSPPATRPAHRQPNQGWNRPTQPGPRKASTRSTTAAWAPPDLNAAALSLARQLRLDAGDEGQVSTSLERLAARTGQPVDAVRDGLAALTTVRFVTVHRDAEPVDVADVAAHARFMVRLAGP
jgi:hypothetical protein